MATLWKRATLSGCMMTLRVCDGMSLRAKRSNLDCFVALLLAMTGFFFTSQAVFALTSEEEKEIRDEAKTFQYSEVVAKSGLKYRVPEDMPIEVRNGIEAPIPFDEYMYAKFKKMDERLERIENTLARIEKSINLKSEKKLLS